MGIRVGEGQACVGRTRHRSRRDVMTWPRDAADPVWNGGMAPLGPRMSQNCR